MSNMNLENEIYRPQKRHLFNSIIDELSLSDDSEKNEECGELISLKIQIGSSSIIADLENNSIQLIEGEQVITLTEDSYLFALLNNMFLNSHEIDEIIDDEDTSILDNKEV